MFEFLNAGILKSVYSDVPYWTVLPWYVLIPAVFGVAIIAYLLGSINSAIIVSKVFFGEDVRTKGSGNAGTTNVLRNYGKKAALLTLIGDMLKTAISIFIAGLVFGFNYVGGVSVSEMCYIAGLFSVIGHVFPIYYKLRGGKGVLSTATLALILSPICALILIAIFVGIVAFSKFVSLGSVIAVVLYPVVLNGYFAVLAGGAKPMPLMVLTTILLAILIVWCHRANLARISRGEENKLSFGKKKAEPIEEPVSDDEEEE
jgi:glycerol-3-phosphate acyltransferase PlsY